MYLHKFSLNELEEMMPWERDVYKTLLENYLKEKREKKNKGFTL